MYGRSYLALTVGVLVLGILFQQPALTTLGLLSGLTLLIAWGWQAACQPQAMSKVRPLSRPRVVSAGCWNRMPSTSTPTASAR